MTTTSLLKSEAEEFCDLIQRGIECWYKAGKIAAEELDKDPKFAERVASKNPMITEEMVIRFAQVGRKMMHPQLLVDGSPGMRALERLPYALQEKYIKEPVPLLVKTDGGWDTLSVDVRNLTIAQAKQVFNGHGVRSESAQRAWLEDQKAKSIKPSTGNMPYRVVGRQLVILEPCKLTVADMARILAEIER